MEILGSFALFLLYYICHWSHDWNKDSYKYCIIKNSIGNVVDAYCSLPHFLAFQSDEIAEEFLKNFRELIEQAGDLI